MDIPFHYAFKVKDLPSTRHFYGDVIGCVEGRSSQTWVDFDFFGHQISAHIDKQLKPLKRRDYIGKVDGIQVPIPHFGCVLWVDFDFFGIKPLDLKPNYKRWQVPLCRRRLK